MFHISAKRNFTDVAKDCVVAVERGFDFDGDPCIRFSMNGGSFEVTQYFYFEDAPLTKQRLTQVFFGSQGKTFGTADECMAFLRGQRISAMAISEDRPHQVVQWYYPG